MSLLDKTLIIKEQVNQMKAKLNLPPDTPIQTVTDSITSGGGGGDTNVYRVKTLEERDAITTAKEGDLCIVIDGGIAPITKTSIFSTVTFPETVVLDSAMTDYADVMFRSVDPNQRIDCWGSLDSRSFRADFMTGNPETDLRVNYQSSDGVTYTRQDYSTGAGPAPTPFNFGTNIKYDRPEYWNPAIGKFMLISNIVFEGIFEYKEGAWTFAKIGANATADNIWAPAKLYTDKGMVESKTPRAIYSKQNIYIQNTEPEIKKGLWLTLHSPAQPEYNYSSDRINLGYTRGNLNNDVNLFKPLSRTLPIDTLEMRISGVANKPLCSGGVKNNPNLRFTLALIKNKVYILYSNQVLGADGSNPWCYEYTLSIYNIDTDELKENVYRFPRKNYLDLDMYYDNRDTLAFRTYTSTTAVSDKTRDVYLLNTNTDVITPKLSIRGFAKDNGQDLSWSDIFINHYFTIVEGNGKNNVRIIDVNTNTFKDIPLTPVASASYNWYEGISNIKNKEKDSICIKEGYTDKEHNNLYCYYELNLKTGSLTPITKTENDGWEKGFIELSKEHNLYYKCSKGVTAPVSFGSYKEGSFVEENYILNIKDVAHSRNMGIVMSCFKNNLYLICNPRYKDDLSVEYNKKIYKLSLNNLTRDNVLTFQDTYMPELYVIVQCPKHLNSIDSRLKISDIVTAPKPGMDFYIPYDVYKNPNNSINPTKEDQNYVPKNLVKDIYIGYGTKWIPYKSHSINDVTMSEDIIKLDFSTIKNSWGLSEVIYFKLPESVKKYTYWHLAVNEPADELILYKYNNAAVYKDNNYISEVSQPWDLEIFRFNKEELKFELDHTYQHSGSSIDGFPVVAANFENYINNY